MGLLDDAIREHLELKRRRGADPGEVAREQQEVLDAGPSGEAAARDLDITAGAVEADGAAMEADAAAVPEDELREPGATDAPAPSDREEAEATIGQETAKLDMQSVLDAGHDPALPSSPAGPTFTDAPGEADWPAQPYRDKPPLEEDDMSDVPRQLPGQERLSFE